MIAPRHSTRERRNPPGRATKHPTMALVRRFDPTGEELTTWAPLYVSDEGVTFFSPTKAKAAARKPPRDAGLHVGDLIVTVPAEGVSSIEEYATGLYVVTPDGVKAAPVYFDEPWLAMWGHDAYDMLHASASVDRRRLVMAACECAETVLHLVRAGDDRPRKAIETARAWCFGRASLDDVMGGVWAADRAASAAFSAADVAAANRAAHVRAASAAFSAADVAAANRAAHVRAASATAYAAGAAHAAAGTPEAATYRLLAPLVDRWIPLPVLLLSRLGYPEAIPFDLSVAPTRTNPSHSTRRPLPRSRQR